MKYTAKQNISLSPPQSDLLVNKLKVRFEESKYRHKDFKWADVEKRLASKPEKIWSLNEMEKTGGEPDVVGYSKKTGEYFFMDCSKETPKGRTSLCYDGSALKARKEHKPRGSAVEMAAAMGVELLTEEEYQMLQQIVECDMKTSSWLRTPDEVRVLGGGLYGDRRYNRVFIGHNGVQSYYAARGFRGSLKV